MVSMRAAHAPKSVSGRCTAPPAPGIFAPQSWQASRLSRIADSRVSVLRHCPADSRPAVADVATELGDFKRAQEETPGVHGPWSLRDLTVESGILKGQPAASLRAAEIPAYGRRARVVSLVRRGLDWLAAPARTHVFRWRLAPPEPVRI
jgi:hypothetical protein